MQLQASLAALSLALTAFAVEASVPVTIYNQCSESIDLYDNSATETVAAGSSTSRTLADGYHGMMRNGANSQATLAELSVTGGFLWYDISIIPTGSVGPGYCPSLEECKEVTGGVGFNTAMQIAPSGCTSVTCLEDGCEDAYQFPKDDAKTHACADTTTVELTFCPGGSGGSTTKSSSTSQTTQSTTSAPTTAAPTTAPPTQAPTTQAPTQAPTPVLTTAAPTPVPTTAAPTPEPTTATPIPTTATPIPTTATPIPTTATPIPTTATPIPTTATPIPTTATPMPSTETPIPTTDTPIPTTATPVSTTETPTNTPEVTYAKSNATSSDETEQATVAPKTESTSTSSTAQVVSAPTTSTSSKSNSDSTESANTQSSGDSSTGAGTYIATGLGCVAVVAAVAVVAVARKKKAELDATEGKQYTQEDLMTPVTQINVL